jgi:nucleoside 2-deoxyribosyltransferase
MIIYLAGPDVFLPDAVEIGRRKAEICALHGLTGLYPLDNAVNPGVADASLTIFKSNEAMMESADAIIANLTRVLRRSGGAGAAGGGGARWPPDRRRRADGGRVWIA